MARRAYKFDSMPLAELVQLRDRAAAALASRIERERKDLNAKIEALNEFDAHPTRAKRGYRKEAKAAAPRRPKAHPLRGRKAAAKYRGPSGDTWAGRGLTPRWLTALEKQGKKREAFLIKQSSNGRGK
jgi:DNA-binding protein H-NS